MRRELNSNLDDYEAAGICILRRFDDEAAPKLLFLVNNSCKLDITKGRRDSGENDPLQTAMREAEEEAGIDDLQFTWGRNRCLRMIDLIIYVAETRQNPRLAANPTSGEFEHQYFFWSSLPDILRCRINNPTLIYPILNWVKTLRIV